MPLGSRIAEGQCGCVVKGPDPYLEKGVRPLAFGQTNNHVYTHKQTSAPQPGGTRPFAALT